MMLAQQRWGEGPRQALLVHGLSSSAAGWWRLGPALADLGFSVTAPDLRGHGNSGPAASYELASYAADLLELAGPWDVAIGHSLGGAAVILGAVAQPEWTRRAVLLDPAVWMPPDPETEALLTSPFRMPLTPEAVMEANPTWHAEDARIKAEALRSTSIEVVLDTFRANLPWNIVPQLAQIPVPTLIVGADPALGALVPRSLGDGLAALAENVEYVWIRHASHSVHRDEFDATWAAVSEWLT